MTLKKLLHDYGISQRQLAQRIVSPQGKPYSTAVINRIVNHGKYPKAGDIEDIQAQIKAVLSTLGVHCRELQAIRFGGELDLNKDKKQTTNNLTENLEMQTLSQAAKQVFKPR